MVMFLSSNMAYKQVLAVSPKTTRMTSHEQNTRRHRKLNADGENIDRIF